MGLMVASEKCHQEKRKTVNGEDIIFAMTSLGFENYAEVLKIYLSKYRQVSRMPKGLIVRATRMHLQAVAQVPREREVRAKDWKRRIS